MPKVKESLRSLYIRPPKNGYPFSESTGEWLKSLNQFLSMNSFDFPDSGHLSN
jgi:hypothetical protein